MLLPTLSSPSFAAELSSKSKSRCTPTRSARFSLITARSRNNFIRRGKDSKNLTAQKNRLLSRRKQVSLQ